MGEQMSLWLEKAILGTMPNSHIMNLDFPHLSKELPHANYYLEKDNVFCDI